jgi:hypothetical protein
MPPLSGFDSVGVFESTELIRFVALRLTRAL